MPNKSKLSSKYISVKHLIENATVIAYLETVYISAEFENPT